MKNFLKKIELQGFKSFAEKTVFEFPFQITAIVGPNGSGKSNIVDAFKWVLGEREAKQLRGEKLENLIFAGTPKKPASGIAKVNLVFNNEKNVFPFNLKEVNLTRKIDRSGNSQFFLNDEEIRLKDLIVYLAKAKISTRGLMIISQGDSDIFVRSSPIERRMFIEEILGLKEYRLKKNQAKNQLVISQNNLEKLKVTLNEIIPHLKFLRKQKNKWEKRLEIEKELRDLEDKYFGFKYFSLKENLSKLEPNLKALENEMAERLKEIKVEEEKLEKINKSFIPDEDERKIKEKIKYLLEKRYQLEKELGKIEVKIEFFKNSQINFNQKEIDSLLKDLFSDLQELIKINDLNLIKEKLNYWLQILKSFFKTEKEEEKNNLIKKQEEILAELEKIEKEYNLLTLKEEELAKKQKDYNLEFQKLFQNLEEKRKVYFTLEKQKESLLFEKEKILNRLNELKIQFEIYGRKFEEIEKLKIDLIFENDWQEIEKKIQRLRNELNLIGEIDENILKEAEQTESRYQLIEKEVLDLEKAIYDLKILIKDLNNKINSAFAKNFHLINSEFNNFFRLMFNGGKASFKIIKEEKKDNEIKDDEEDLSQESLKEKIEGIDIELNIPKKKIKNLEMLSGGEKSLVSLAALFALIAVSSPPFLILDEIDAPLDDINAQRFANLIKQFSYKTQFIIITHNRVTMEAAEALYGITMAEDGVSKVYSLRLEKEK